MNKKVIKYNDKIILVENINFQFISIGCFLKLVCASGGWNLAKGQFSDL